MPVSSSRVDLQADISSLEGQIHGQVHDGRGRSVAFRGWIELAAAVTAIVEDAHESTFVSQPEEPPDDHS